MSYVPKMLSSFTQAVLNKSLTGFPLLRFGFLILLIQLCESSGAVVSCIHNDLKDFGKLTQKTAEFADSGTHRETVSERAESHKNTTSSTDPDFNATGRLYCPGSEVSANLVVKNDVIVTVAHMFVDRDTCKKKRDVKSCSFKVEGQPAVQLDSLEVSGSQCPVPFDENHDWAIIKLKKPIAGVKPYSMRSSGRDIDPQSVTAVGNSSVDFRRKDPKTGKMVMPKHVQDCAIKRTYPRYDPVVFNSNCDGSFGKSGGAVLGLDNGAMVIVGISTGSPLSDAEEAQELKTGKPVRKNYESNKWADTGIAITGSFYDNLKRITQ